MDEENVTITTELSHIDQHTIECDLRAFTSWLNRLVDQLNYTTRIAIYAKNLAEKNEKRICLLEERVENLEQIVLNIDRRLTKAEGDIINIFQQLDILENTINQVNARVDLLYSWLPIPYGMIDPKGWKFAMGNINCMSDNGGTPNLDIGIITHYDIKDNDIYFN